ncbi:MAG: SulP family inorganic anion transporter [Rhodospirillales bacterium]
MTDAEVADEGASAALSSSPIDRENSRIASFFAGPVVALGSMVNMLGGAALAFPGVLSPHIGVVIGAMLAGSIVAAIIGAFRAGLRGTLMENQEAPAMLLGLMGVAVFVSLPEGLSEGDRVATVIAAFALTTVTTGIFFLLLGWLRLGELIRYIPFPVIGGVLAGLGLLMMEGALSVATGLSINAENIPRLFETDMLLRWLPALVFAGVIAQTTSKLTHFLTIPILLSVATAVFYVVALGLGMTADRLSGDGWLLGPFPDGSLFQPVDYGALARIDGGVLFSMVPKMASVMLIATIGVLLHASGLELAAREEVELNRELRVCGAGNIGAGLFGSAPCFHSMSNTLLARTMGAGNRLTPLVAVGFWIFVLIFGGAVLGYFPRPVLSGLLLFLGGGLLWEWLVQGYRRLPLGDWVVVALIVLTVAVVGYMEGIGLGVIAGVILFQIGYTKIDVVKHVLSGASFRSNVERSDAAMTALDKHGHRILALQLQGYIFFGTANNIVLKVREWLEEARGIDCDWLVIDFRPVGGLDWAAVMSFRKLMQLAEKEGITVVFSIPDDRIRQILTKGDIIGEGHARVFGILDEAMEWCEDRLLDDLGIASATDVLPDTLPGLIARAFPDGADQARLRHYLTRRRFEAGEVLMRQGEEASSLLLIQGGRASVYLEDSDDGRIRVKSYEAGSIVGEVGLYSGAPRTATVLADTEIAAFALTRESFLAMREEEPALAGRFDEVIINLLGKRLAGTNRLVASLMT